VLLEKAHSLSQEWGGAPVVIAGDFNSTPLSAVYHYISTSELDVSQLDRKQLSGQDDNENCNTWPAQQLPTSEVNR
jgi:endonuclease/exonuclease/phosphatase family metal-dependent hydrolase